MLKVNSLSEIIKRHFTKDLENTPNKTVFDMFQWKKVDVHIKDYKTGNLLFQMNAIEFPSNYSQNACDIIASKYFRRTGVPNELGYENSMKLVAHRLVNFWTEALVDEGLINTPELKQIYYDEMVYGLLAQIYAPNSPQWFNTGLALSYGISGNKQGHYYFDEKENEVLESNDAYTRTQASACFILSINDTLLGPHSISEQYVTETKLFKGGSGTGTNFSSLRAKGEKLSGGGYSSGLMSFLKGFDRNAGAIKSGGTTRRAAKMLCLNVDHPEIEDFISWKSKEEKKVRALDKMGYAASFEGEAYETVSGQNGNNSIRFSDEFMCKVANLPKSPEATITLRGRVDNAINKEVLVNDLWKKFNQSSWECADPAPQFDDTFNAWHTCPYGESGEYNANHNRINSTNPCGEYAFLDDTACNLASINIYKLYDGEKNKFDLSSYTHLVGLVQLALEASIHWGHFPTKDIARKSYMFRTTGLGIANISSLLMVKGFPYDSEEARSYTSALIGILTGYSYFVSSLIAKEIGPFKCYNINNKSMSKVIRNHCRVAGLSETPYEGLNYEPLKINHKLLLANGFEELSSISKDVWSNALENGTKYGFRNAQVSVIAPTGTISLAMDCGATSIEPFFSHVAYKKLSGGGYMTIANPVLHTALTNLGYTENEVIDIIEYIMRTEVVQEDGFEYQKIVDGKIEGAPHLKEEHLAIFDTANVCGSGHRFISPMGHVKFVAVITPLISGAISKTVNLPNSATLEDFENVVLKSWKLGIKGISLYRDGSKASQPLNNTLSNNEKVNLEDLSYNDLLAKAKKLNDTLIEAENKIAIDLTEEQIKQFPIREKLIGIRTGTTHPAQIDDVKIYTTVNRNQRNEISEIYITTDREGTIISGLLNSLSKSISVMLQYHVPPYDIANMLRGQKYEPYGFVLRHPNIKYVTSISDLISKIIDIELGNYTRCQVKPEDNKNIKANQTSNSHKVEGQRVYDSVCSVCSSTRMVRNGTCKICLDCGSTTGCS